MRTCNLILLRVCRGSCSGRGVSLPLHRMLYFQSEKERWVVRSGREEV